jgi:hypothetical protein
LYSRPREREAVLSHLLSAQEINIIPREKAKPTPRIMPYPKLVGSGGGSNKLPAVDIFNGG